MILVSGAGGKTGQAIVKKLAKRGESVRAWVHRPEQTAHLQTLGAVEVVHGDMRDKETVALACKGARAVYHICPNMSPDEFAIGSAILQAACEAEAAHFVYHSVLHPQVKAMPHHWAKMQVEELIFEAGIPFTILQPAAYMQNTLAGRSQIVERGRYTVPYAVETSLAMVDLADVAEAAARVLTGPGHSGAIYELVGEPALTQTKVAEIISAHLKRPVQAETILREAWQANAQKAGLSEYAIDTLLKMFVYYERFGFAGNPRVLGWLLGRAPTRFHQFVEREFV